MNITTIYKATGYLLIAIVLAAVTACSSEETTTANSDGNSTFTVVAEVAQQLHSRAYQAEGYVREGIYYLSYPLPTTGNPYNVAWVNFNKDGTTPGIGIVTVPENEELTWNEGVGGGATPTFYLDNVKSELGTDGSDQTRIVFTEDNNPYKAAVFDSIDGTNDLLWGEQMVRRGDKTIYFDLHHNMSRVRVQVTVDHTNEDPKDVLDLKGATVEISSINQTPIAYNRLDGSLELKELDENENNEDIYMERYAPLTLVGEGIEEWLDSWKDETDENKETYITHSFVLPPQRLLEKENRPRLTIKLTNGKVYSGILPYAMLIDNGTHDEPSYPVALYFLKEHILTIRTVITETPPELAFMPVWVMEWVDKKEHSVEAHQSGIYTSKEFYDLIDYYEANNEYHFTRYGEFEEGKWRFDFFSSVELDYDKIYDKMKPGTTVDGNDENKTKDFSFNFNAYTVYVKYEDASKKEVRKTLTGPEELYQIVTGEKPLP